MLNSTDERFALITPEKLLTQYAPFHENLGEDPYHRKEKGGRTRRLAQHYMTYERQSDEIKISRLKTQPFLQGEYNKLTGHIQRPFEDHLPETDMKPYIQYGFREIISRWPEERNGVEYIIMGCVGKQNLSGAESTLYKSEDPNSALYSYTLRPGEALLVDDRELMHGVSPVVAEGDIAYRDMILMGFHYWRRDHYRADWKDNLHDHVKPEHTL